MDVLSGSGGNNDDESPRPLPRLRQRRHHHVKRRASLSMLPLSDTFLFKAPQPTYVASSWPGELCVLGSSVCLALERFGGASRVVLFCHGTSSDLGMSRRSLETLRDGLESHVIAVEYPGYGLTAREEPSEDSVNAAVRGVFLHLTKAMCWPAERVVVMGRSLGSGPAVRLAKEFKPGALFLLAPFTSIKEIAGSILGVTLASVFNLDQWRNKEEIESTTCPTLLIHGLKDTVVPHTHSLQLYRASPASQKYVGLLKESDHNRINWRAACGVYARPFLETACPHETYCDRTLGLVPADVEKLSLFDTSSSSSNGRLLVACAEAAWQRRRSEAGPLHEAAIKAGNEAREKQQKREKENPVQSPSSMVGMTGGSAESLIGDDALKDRVPMQELPLEPAATAGDPAAIDANDRDKPEVAATVAETEKIRARGDSRVGQGGGSVNEGWKLGWRGLSALLLPGRGRRAVSQGV